jgi:Aldo/keto reductase family
MVAKAVKSRGDLWKGGKTVSSHQSPGLQSAVLEAAAAFMKAKPMQVALAWLLHRARNILLIPGTSSIHHLLANLKAAALQLAPETIAELDAGGIFRRGQSGDTSVEEILVGQGETGQESKGPEVIGEWRDEERTRPCLKRATSRGDHCETSLANGFRKLRSRYKVCQT